MTFTLGVSCTHRLEQLPQTTSEQRILLKEKEKKDGERAQQRWHVLPSVGTGQWGPWPLEPWETTQPLWLCAVTIKKKVGGWGNRPVAKSVRRWREDCI